MSSKPDGTDDRILQPEGKTVCIAKTTGQSKTSRYHDPECRILHKLKGEPNEIDIAVAEWKGYKQCNHCDPETESTQVPAVDGNEVDRLRRALVEGYSSTVVGEGRDMSKATVRYHAKGYRDYNYLTEPETPTVDYSQDKQAWGWTDE